MVDKIKEVGNQFKWISEEATKNSNNPKKMKELKARFLSETKSYFLLLESLGITEEFIKKLADESK